MAWFFLKLKTKLSKKNWLCIWCPLRHKSNKNASGEITSCLQEFCPPSFWATENVSYRWKAGDENMTGVEESDDGKLSPEQNKSSPRWRKWVFPRVWSWRFDFWKEKDFKKWMTTLINQLCVSNQTSKPSMQRDGGWAGWFIDESGERTKRGEV